VDTPMVSCDTMDLLSFAMSDTGRPRAPDEGGTDFGGFGQGGYAQQASDVGWWQPCPTGYVRSDASPYNCVPAGHFYGSGLKRYGMWLPVIAGITALVGGALFLRYMSKRKERYGGCHCSYE